MVEGLVKEPQAPENLACPGLQGVAAPVLVPLLDRPVLREHVSTVLSRSQALLQIVQPVAQVEEVGAGGDGLLQHRVGGQFGVELVEHADPSPALARYLPGRGLQLAADQSQHGGLARAVGSHDAEALAGLYAEVQVAEDGGGAVFGAHPVEAEEGHCSTTLRRWGWTTAFCAADLHRLSTRFWTTYALDIG